MLAPGDLNLTFKSYVRDAGHAAHRGRPRRRRSRATASTPSCCARYLAAFGERDAYAISHVGWGMNHGARWDYLPLYDRSQLNGTEARAFAGNFLYSTGANEIAGPLHRAATSTCRCGAAPSTLDGGPWSTAGVLGHELK